MTSFSKMAIMLAIRIAPAVSSLNPEDSNWKILKTLTNHSASRCTDARTSGTVELENQEIAE